MTAPFADLRTGGVLRRWLKRAPEDQPIPCQRATYYIGGRQVAYEEWGGDPRLPELLSQDDLDFEALRGPSKASPPPDPDRSKVILWWLAASLVTIGVTIAAVATASTLEPQYDETGRPYFAAEGLQCWSGKYHGEPMDCALIDVTYRQEVRPKARPCTPFRGFCEVAAEVRPDTYLTVVQAQSQTQHQAQAQSQRQTGTGGGSGSTSVLSLLTRDAVTYQTGNTFLTQITQSEVTLIGQNFFTKDCPPDETITETPDPSPVPLPAGVVLLLSAVGLLAMKGRRNA